MEEHREESGLDINWEYWEKAIRNNGISIDRPKGSRHPRYPDRVYPIDYGYINNTKGADNEEVDVFVGDTDSGLVGALFTVDRVKNDKEFKFLWNVTKEEAKAALAFVNFGWQSGEIIWKNGCDRCS